MVVTMHHVGHFFFYIRFAVMLCCHSYVKENGRRHTRSVLNTYSLLKVRDNYMLWGYMRCSHQNTLKICLKSWYDSTSMLGRFPTSKIRRGFASERVDPKLPTPFPFQYLPGRGLPLHYPSPVGSSRSVVRNLESGLPFLERQDGFQDVQDASKMLS